MAHTATTHDPPLAEAIHSGTDSPHPSPVAVLSPARNDGLKVFDPATSCLRRRADPRRDAFVRLWLCVKALPLAQTLLLRAAEELYSFKLVADQDPGSMLRGPHPKNATHSCALCRAPSSNPANPPPISD